MALIRRMKGIVAIFAIALTMGACAKSGKNSKGISGRAYYQALNCQVCHSIGGEGGAQQGPDLSFVGFRKSSTWLNLWLKDPQAWKKDTPMPNFHLSKPARMYLVGYLSSLRGEAFGDHRPWNQPSLLRDPVLRGQMIYVHAGCITCHGRGGEGGYPDNNVVGGRIPALKSVSRSFTKEELIRKIKNGSIPAKANPQGPAPLLGMPAWGQVLNDSEIRAVADYLLSLKPENSSAGNW